MSFLPPKKNISNNVLNFDKFIELLPKPNREIDQQENESLNTIDYYKEDISFKNQPIIETNLNPNKLNDQKENINTSINKSCNNSFILLQNYNKEKNHDNNKKESFIRINSFFENKNGINVKKFFEDKNEVSTYCSRCNEEVEFSSRACPYCLKPFCRKCLKEIFKRNLDNNDDIDNFDQDIINEKICPNCRNLVAIKDYIILKKNKKNTMKQNKSCDIYSINNPQTQQNMDYNKNSHLFKGLEEENNEYEILLNKIEENKRQLEIRKNLSINILQIIQKSIEYEYNQNLNKLNEMILKLQNIKNSIEERKNIFNQRQKNNDNNLIIQKNIDKYKNALNCFSKNYNKFNERIILKSKQKAFQLHESKSFSVNLSDTYNMKYIEILSNNQIGNVYFKIDRFNINYINYLNFSVLIEKNDKETKNNNNLKSKFIVNMIINNKIIKLNEIKTKDDNKLCLNYECSLNENKILLSNNNSNSSNFNRIKDELNIQVILSELFL